VSLREVCIAIEKYAFVASPYPIIISAEIHCSLAQQDQIAEIMKSTFGDALVTAPLQDREVTDTLPSPEELRGWVLVKAKNLYVEETQANLDKAQPFDTERSTENSITELEHVRGMPVPLSLLLVFMCSCL
jgi:phosphatidylinositol phospholipase C, delta